MKIAVIGTGMVGRAVAARFQELGHDAVIGTRDPAATLTRTDPDDKGTPPFSQWHADHAEIALLPMAEAGAHGEIVINATAGADSLVALELVGAERLAGKVLLTIALPLDLSEGRPPKLLFANDDSLGERVQHAFPDARVVESLNTMQFEVMMDPSILPGRHNVFVSGDDATAKEVVTHLLHQLGWPADTVVDLGDIITARAAEMYSRLLFTLAQKYGDYHTNIALVRPAT